MACSGTAVPFFYLFIHSAYMRGGVFHGQRGCNRHSARLRTRPEFVTWDEIYRLAICWRPVPLRLFETLREVLRFHVYTTASMKMTGLWDMAPCSLVEEDRRFRRANCLHHQDNRPDDGGSTPLWIICLVLRDRRWHVPESYFLHKEISISFHTFHVRSWYLNPFSWNLVSDIYTKS
jgi:hypothetical protein